MTTWKDGGPYGRYCRGVHNESGDKTICYVWVKENGRNNSVVDCPQGEANFALILAAPRMLDALCDIRDQAECYLQPLRAVGVSRARWEAVRDRAVATIAVAKGEDSDAIG